MKVSIIVPVYNERESLPKLHEELRQMLEGQAFSAEILYVDDGSRDGSPEILQQLAETDARIRVIRFARNFGQTAAMAAGIEHATGDVLVPMDADLQNDPADIPKLLAELDRGYDVVSGWRKNRQDKLITRKIPSRIANRIIGKWTGVHLNDFGCTLKAYRASVLRGTRLYGEMHRFVPVYAFWRGARVTEMVVNHRSRQFGQSKYGLSRTIRVMLDLVTLKLLGSYSTKPSHLFGGVGMVSMGLGALAFLVVVVERIVWHSWQEKGASVLLLSTFLFTVGIVLIMMGLLGELIMRVYHEAHGKRTYVLHSEIHGEPGPSDPKAPSDPRTAA